MSETEKWGADYTPEAIKFVRRENRRPRVRIEPHGRYNEDIDVIDRHGKKTYYCEHGEPRTTCMTCYDKYFDWID